MNRSVAGGSTSKLQQQNSASLSFTIHQATIMVSVTISLKGKPTINCDFPSKHPQDVTVRDLKAAVQAKFPKVSPPYPSNP